MTTPALFFQALTGLRADDGPERCFWCGSRCAPKHAVKDCVSDTFFGFNEVAASGSDWICPGCVEATRTERSIPGYGSPRKTWQFSWIITPGRAEAVATATMAGAVDSVRDGDPMAKSAWWQSQAETIAAACLCPPEPPYAITIAVGGQKHLLYRTPVNFARDVVTVQFELEQVTFRPHDMADRMRLARQIAAACGKPALAARPGASAARGLAMYYTDARPLMAWFDVWQQPMSRLAAYLTPKKETCQSDFPSDRLAG